MVVALVYAHGGSRSLWSRDTGDPATSCSTNSGVPGGEFYFATRSRRPLGTTPLRDGLLGVDLPRSYLEPLDPAVLNGTLGAVTEIFQAGASSVLAVVEDYDALCGLSVDPMSLLLVPSSSRDRGVHRWSGCRRFPTSLRAASRPRGGSRYRPARCVRWPLGGWRKPDRRPLACVKPAREAD